jgi:hypothetical protein
VPYASVDDLTAFLGSLPLPLDVSRLLEEASDDLDGVLVGARYATDDSGMPTDAAVQTALRKACERQVHWLMDRDDETGATSDVQSMTTGSRSVTRRTGANAAATTPQLGPRAAQALRTSGLLHPFPVTFG